MNLEFNEEQLNLKCKIHGKKIEITYQSEGQIDYKWCCHSFRSNFVKIIDETKKRKQNESRS